MVELKPTHADDPDFLQLVTKIINNLFRLHSPEEVYAIEIDHWFDHKWQYFAGKTLGALPRWRSTLTVPPFDPGRVVRQDYFRVSDAGTYVAELPRRCIWISGVVTIFIASSSMWPRLVSFSGIAVRRKQLIAHR